MNNVLLKVSEYFEANYLIHKFQENLNQLKVTFTDTTTQMVGKHMFCKV